MRKSLIICGSLIALLAASSPAFAAFKPSKALPRSPYGGFSLTPTIGGFLSSGAEAPETTILYGFKFGYDKLETSITNSLGVEGTLNYFTTKVKTGSGPVDGYIFRVDALYPFIIKSRFVPFVAVGLGGINTSTSGKSELNPLLDYGAGVKYFLEDDLAVRVDARHLLEYKDVNVQNHFEAAIGLSYYFGKEKKIIPPPPVKPKTKEGVKKRSPGIVLPIPIPGLTHSAEGEEPAANTKIICLKGVVAVESSSSPAIAGTITTPSAEAKPGQEPQAKPQVVLTQGDMIVVEKNKPLPAAVPASPADLESAMEAAIVEETPPGAASGRSEKQSADAQEVVGKVVELHGKVAIERAGSVVAAKMNTAVQAGDIIKTAAGSEVKVRFSDSSTVTLAEKSKVVVKDFMPQGVTDEIPPVTGNAGREGESGVGSSASAMQGARTNRGTKPTHQAPGKVAGKVTVRFDIAQWEIKPGYNRQLRKIADILNSYPGSSALIEGHSDVTGSKEYNLELSSQRAESVKKALAAMGADPEKITTRGYGYSRPQASNATEKGRRLNRRAVTTVTILVAPAEASPAPAE